MTWRAVTGDPAGTDFILTGAGIFKDMPLPRATEFVLECRLELPATVAGVPQQGQPLELTINSLYPCRLELDGRTVFEDLSRVPVAAGPALIEVLPGITPGETVSMRHTIFIPDNQITAWWHRLQFTTPGLRARFEELDLLAAQLLLAKELAVEPDEIAACERADEVLLRQMDGGGDPVEIAPQVVAILEPLAKKISALSVHLIGHTHIDLNWLWTWEDTKEVVRRDFRSVLGLMKEFPELTFSHSQAATYDLVAREEPGLFSEVLGHIASKRWEPICMTWVEQDSNMCGSEAHARQLLHGAGHALETLGTSPTVCHAPDTFGHPGNLPQIAAAAGARYYYHHRCNPGGDWQAYWWEGDDGSRLLALCTPSYNGEITAGDLVKAVLMARRQGLNEGMHFHGIGDHGGGPARHNLQTLRRLQKAPLLPKAFCSTMEKYGRAVESSGVELPVHRGESRTIFEGCYTTHSDTKKYNRDGENLLLTAETLSALAGIDARQSLNPAWRTVLFNQFHDILAGSAIHEVYEDQAADFQGIKDAAEEVSRAAIDVIAGENKPGEIAVVNPLPDAREDWVFIANDSGEAPERVVADSGESPVQRVGEGYGFVARTGGYGVSHYLPASGKSGFGSDLKVSPAFSPFDNREPNILGETSEQSPYFKIETRHFRAYLRRDCGVLVSFLDKRVNRELVSFGLRRQSDYVDTARPDLALGVFQILSEAPHGMTAWQMQEVHTEQSLISGAATTLIEEGPVRCVFETVHTSAPFVISQRTIFYAELPWFDFETRITLQEPGSKEAGVKNLKVSFCARLAGCDAWFETPYGAALRPADGQETPLLRWADVGNDDYGLAILSDGNYGCDALGSRLRLSLVRGAYDPDSIADVGTHTMRYRLVPHPGSWRDANITSLASGFNQPMLTKAAAAGPASASRAASKSPRPSISPGTIRFSCLKRAEKGNGFALRLYESGGRCSTQVLHGIPADWNVFETNVLEQGRKPLRRNADGGIPLTLEPWKIMTIVVEPAGGQS